MLNSNLHLLCNLQDAAGLEITHAPALAAGLSVCGCAHGREGGDRFPYPWQSWLPLGSPCPHLPPAPCWCGER